LPTSRRSSARSTSCSGRLIADSAPSRKLPESLHRPGEAISPIGGGAASGVRVPLNWTNCGDMFSSLTSPPSMILATATLGNVLTGEFCRGFLRSSQARNPCSPWPHCWRGTSRPDLGERWPAWLVATASEDRLNIRRNSPHAFLLSLPIAEAIAIYEYTPFYNGPGDVKSPRVIVA
jgi:hypothetical protein